jgi:hypothetical protein
MLEGLFGTSLINGRQFVLNGYGQYISADKYYVGWWTNGKRNGFGTQHYITTNGKGMVESGCWDMDKFIPADE